MATQPEGAEDFRVLEELVCEATPGPGVPAAAPQGSGVNAGVRALSEFIVRASHAPLTAERVAALRAMSNRELLALVRSAGPELSPAELGVIHDLALERLTQDDSLASEGVELSRETMRVALERIA
jgi:hypothetical protein